MCEPICKSYNDNGTVTFTSAELNCNNQYNPAPFTVMVKNRKSTEGGNNIIIYTININNAEYNVVQAADGSYGLGSQDCGIPTLDPKFGILTVTLSPPCVIPPNTYISGDKYSVRVSANSPTCPGDVQVSFTRPGTPTPPSPSNSSMSDWVIAMVILVLLIILFFVMLYVI